MWELAELPGDGRPPTASPKEELAFLLGLRLRGRRGPAVDGGLGVRSSMAG